MIVHTRPPLFLRMLVIPKLITWKGSFSPRSYSVIAFTPFAAAADSADAVVAVLCVSYFRGVADDHTRRASGGPDWEVV